MGLTTEEENVCFYFFFFFGREEGRKDVLADGGSEKAGLAEGGHGWLSDEETLEIRVNRIEEKPLGLSSIR